MLDVLLSATNESIMQGVVVLSAVMLNVVGPHPQETLASGEGPVRLTSFKVACLVTKVNNIFILKMS